MGVQAHLEDVPFAPLVATGQAGGDAVGLAVVAHAGDVERLVVVDNLEFRALGGRLSLVRVALDEAGVHGRAEPGFVVEDAVDDRGDLSPYNPSDPLRVLEPTGHVLAGRVDGRAGAVGNRGRGGQQDEAGQLCSERSDPLQTFHPE